MGEHPIGAGGVSNIWGAIHNGCMVVVKSYRLYEVSDVAEIVAVCYHRCLYQRRH